MSRALLLVFGWLLAMNVCAAAVDVMGSRTCAKWSEERRMSDSIKEMTRIPVLITRSWFLGYLSGRAEASGVNFLKGTDSESIFLWLDIYCRANPDHGLERAGVALGRELTQMKGMKR